MTAPVERCSARASAWSRSSSRTKASSRRSKRSSIMQRLCRGNRVARPQLGKLWTAHPIVALSRRTASTACCRLRATRRRAARRGTVTADDNCYRYSGNTCREREQLARGERRAGRGGGPGGPRRAGGWGGAGRERDCGRTGGRARSGLRQGRGPGAIGTAAGPGAGRDRDCGRAGGAAGRGCGGGCRWLSCCARRSTPRTGSAPSSPNPRAEGGCRRRPAPPSAGPQRASASSRRARAALQSRR